MTSVERLVPRFAIIGNNFFLLHLKLHAKNLRSAAAYMIYYMLLKTFHLLETIIQTVTETTQDDDNYIKVLSAGSDGERTRVQALALTLIIFGNTMGKYFILFLT